jgi:glycosyltransferase involved in cell wall biosynthesis
LVNSSPKVSIGLPVYNGEKYLKQTIDAILAQTFKDFELIISDNASTDSTQDICLQYAQFENRIKYYRNEKNLGAAPNHNRVYDFAKGDYFKWSGYDDIIAPDYLSRCVETLDHNPDVVLCIPKTILIDENGLIISEFDYQADASSSFPHRRFVNFLLKNRSGNFMYGLMRSKSIAQTSLHGSYPSADLVLIAELAFYGKFSILPERLFFRRNHPEQSTKGDLLIERNRVAWFNTSLSSKILLPKWLFLGGCLKAIRKAPINFLGKIYCYLALVRWIFIPANIRALGKDILISIRKSLKF